MPILDSQIIRSGGAKQGQSFTILRSWFRVHQTLVWAGLYLLCGGCRQDPGLASIETDANGYLCRKCGAKLYTDRKVFLENCPQCKQDGLVEVLAYRCPKDQHLTLRPKVPGPEGAAVCEQCNTPLQSALVSPRATDLKSWGAKETAP